MPDWPKYFLDRADTVTIKSDGCTWETDGATFVRCLESGGWQMDAERDSKIAARYDVALRTEPPDTQGVPT